LRVPALCARRLNSGVGLLLLTHTEEKKEYLTSLDVALEPLGFRRPRNHQEWRCPFDAANELWIHVNFGKAVVNPSGGVTYLDLVSALPEDAAPVTGAMTMLQSLLPSSSIYTIDEGSARVARDLQDFGIPFFFRLRDRAFVIERLMSGVPSDWPTISYSSRIRLLPLLVASEGRLAEAHELLDEFRAESSGRDQIIPGYDVFAAAFAERFA
jgi:hypothetical protein